MVKRFIGGAWPYANGSLHLGQVAGLISGDILARYFRAKGDEVLYVSGSDCHGTPIALRAVKEGVVPRVITDKYHSEFTYCFEKLGFSYDIYTKTDTKNHYDFVQQVFKELYKNGGIYPKEMKQVYCPHCEQFLPDRFVEGTCPHCGNEAKGDQCDFCSELLEPLELRNKKCGLCGGKTEVRQSQHLFLKLPLYEKQLKRYVKSAKGWRDNAIAMTERYLKEGLRERAATRDLKYGIDVPIEGYEDKKIYVWVEAVCGYLSATKAVSEERNICWKDFWGEDVESYFIHGKDNIPFHSLILPAILLGLGNLHLPDHMVSSEYLTIEGRKLSTSRNWAIWVPYMVENYNADSIRYFLIINGPEKRDSDFSWREFVNRHNGELLGAFGNFINRTLAFVEKSFQAVVPQGQLEKSVENEIKETYNKAGNYIEEFKFKNAMESIFDLIKYGNKYFDEKSPWIEIKENRESCSNTLYNCVQIIANLSNLLEPFLPFSCDKIRNMLHIKDNSWSMIYFNSKEPLRDVKPLYSRIEKTVVEKEIQRLKENCK